MCNIYIYINFYGKSAPLALINSQTNICYTGGENRSFPHSYPCSFSVWRMLPVCISVYFCVYFVATGKIPVRPNRKGNRQICEKFQNKILMRTFKKYDDVLFNRSFPSLGSINGKCTRLYLCTCLYICVRVHACT